MVKVICSSTRTQILPPNIVIFDSGEGLPSDRLSVDVFHAQSVLERAQQRRANAPLMQILHTPYRLLQQTVEFFVDQAEENTVILLRHVAEDVFVRVSYGFVLESK